MAKRPLEIDMCAGSQLRDTQGETLSVEGADISEMLAGRGRLNDNHGKGFFNCIGKVTAAKKIFKREDCEDDRQRYYWDKVKSPYIYVRGQLFDDEDHPNARAAAAILRNIHKSDCPLKIKASVEGGVIARGLKDPSFLARTKIHSVALTFVPANQATLVEPLNLDKSADTTADMALIKSVLHLAQTTVPSFRQITRDASASKIEANLNKIFELLGNDPVSLELKKSLIKEAIEAKIAHNVKKINELIKRQLDPNSGITFTHEHHDLGGEGDLTHIKAIHPKHGVIGEALFEHRPDGFLEAQGVQVHPEHRRMGIASGMYAHVQKISGKKIKPSYDQTEMGRALWSGTKGIFKQEGVEKALTAGYGGTGAPTNLTGGGVLQSESQGQPKSFRYITCDDCGKEQIYGKFQVKCRECGKAFSMAKLEKFFRG